MPNNTCLQFLANEADEDEGLNDAGIETFKDAPYASTARECGQNSIDAGMDSPIRVRFELLSILSNQFPQIEEFKEVIRNCQEKISHAGKSSDVEIDFFQNAKNILNADLIKVLAISDENTTGLAGPCEQGTPYHALVKSAGVTKKSSETSAGSVRRQKISE